MRKIAIALAFATLLPLAGCVAAVGVRPPRAGMVFVEGRWVMPPRPYAVWVPGHWQRAGWYRSVWVAGHWR